MILADRPGRVVEPADAVGDSPRSAEVAALLARASATLAPCADPFAASRRQGDRVQFFDQLRAFAIFVVLVGHFRHDVFPGGSIGVSVFFALSGYLITSILLGEPVLDWRSAWRFVVRRFLRVWPPYFVAATAILLLMYCALLVLEQQGAEAADAYATLATRFDAYLGDFGEQLLFVRNPSWLGMGVGVFWTLQIEFWFYLTMPLLMLAVGRGRGLGVALVAMLALSLGLRFFPQLNAVWPISMAYGVSPLIIHVAKWFDTLLAGALVAVIAHRQVLAPISRERFRTISTIAACSPSSCSLSPMTTVAWSGR
jgi:peptidoglycan/LPS O-acetylase OafA/YrhL